MIWELPCRNTYVVLCQVLDAPPVPAGQLHHLALQPPLRSISRDGLATNARRGFVISANPGGQAGVGQVSRDISIDGGD